jgi:hypothetical protein
MPPVADRHAQDALFQIRQLPRVEQPLEEYGGRRWMTGRPDQFNTCSAL